MLEPGTYQTGKLVQYIIGIRTEARQRIIEVHYIEVFIYLSACLFLIIELLVFVKQRTYLRIAILAYCFNIFGSAFGVLFCLLTRKLMLRSKTI